MIRRLVERMGLLLFIAGVARSANPVPTVSAEFMAGVTIAGAIMYLLFPSEVQS